MFAYIAKKIAMPNRDESLKCIGWNHNDGYLVCGGKNGLLKILQLENNKNSGGGGTLAMNQNLEGHNNDTIQVVRWNEKYQKLTTSDSQGLIIVWQLHKGLWFEEMVNNRNKSVVTDMKWTSDGKKICIIYADGAVIVGSVGGNREWGKELIDVELNCVEWSPNCKAILFGTSNGELHSYVYSFDTKRGIPDYTFVSKCPILINKDNNSKMIGIFWCAYAARYRPTTRSLAVGFENGYIQLMLHQFDENPIIINTGLNATAMCWNKDGTIFTVAGTKRVQNNTTTVKSSPTSSLSSKLRELHQVQFYNQDGKHLCSIKIPGNGVTGISWDNNGQRLALSVDHTILFATIKSDYKWTYFCNTLVYAFDRSDRPDTCVCFWSPSTDALNFKYVRSMLHLKSGGQRCIFVTRTEDDIIDTTSQPPYVIILCNSIGTPLDSKYIDIEPLYVEMTATHIIVCSDAQVYIWQYANDTIGNKTFIKDGPEYLFNIDEPPSLLNDHNNIIINNDTSDLICAIAISLNTLIIGRESGSLMRYSLPRVEFKYKYMVRCRPKHLSLNCTSQRLSIIDINGLLTLFDLYERSSKSPNLYGVHLSFVRKDVWYLKWSDDNPSLLACMEKTKMYIIRDLSLEEPVQSQCHIASFNNLEIKAINMDELMNNPLDPKREQVVEFHTKSLRDTELLLQTCPIEEAVTFVQDNPHKRLWKLIAKNALQQLNFDLAEKSFVNTKDYPGIQLIKRLKKLPDRQRQKAEVAAYFHRFDEAERIYLDMGETKLAVDMRIRLGDWLRVEKLIIKYDSGNDKMLAQAYNSIGDYYADRLKWNRAYQYYERCNNLKGMSECAFMMDDYDAMKQIIDSLPNGAALLINLGENFLSVGMCYECVLAFEKGKDYQAAVNACVELNEWQLAVEKANKYNIPGIDNILEKCAQTMLKKERIFEAIELYRKANKHMAAAKQLILLAQKASLNHEEPLRTKQFYVLSAIEICEARKGVLQQKSLTSLLDDNNNDNNNNNNNINTIDIDRHLIDNPWHGAEAYHFWILAQQHLLSNDYTNAMYAALRLRLYEDLLPEKDIHSLIALTAFYAKFYGQVSKSFMKLEIQSDKNIQKKYQELALNIFTRHSSKDPNIMVYECPSQNCSNQVCELDDNCNLCERTFDICIASGRIIWQIDESIVTCSRCKHHIYARELRSIMSHCPLCHNRI